jgi:spore coat protein H
MDKRCLIYLFIAFFVVSSCTVIEERTKSDDAYIIAFEINKSQNPSLTKDYTGVFHQPTQSILVSITDIVPIHSLVPTIILSEGATVKPASGETVDFSRPVEFKVTSSSGKVNSYSVSVSVPNSEPVISKITINDAVCPYDKSASSFFYTLAPDNQNSATIFCTGQHISSLVIEGQTVPNGGTFTGSRYKPGNTILVTPVNATGLAGTPVKLVLTSLPLLIINTSETIVNEPKRVCQISLIDPLNRTNKKQHYFPPHRAGIEIRGGLAQSFPKKSYAIEFWYPDKDEEVEEGTSLLGIRNDGDWILDAMYVDRARMRNRVSMDLWTDISKVPHLAYEPNAINGSRGYFVEVFLNDTYQGLYCLSDRVDRKQLKLDKKEGFSYKASYWSLSTEFISGEASYNNSSDTWDGWELKYQSENGATSSPRVKWEPLRDFIRFTVSSTSTVFKSELETRIDLANLTDYLLVTNVLGADDNTGKNSFFSLYNDANPKLFITAWDLDATWGRKWEGSKIDLRDKEFIGITGTPRTDTRYCRPNAFFQRLLRENPSDIKQQMKVRWQQLRSDELSHSKLSARVETYKLQLIGSGAYDRERSRWPGSAEELNSETAFMISWMQNRLRQMDEIINGL